MKPIEFINYSNFVSRRVILRFYSASLVLLLNQTVWQTAWAKTAPETQIHVTLLGQPCLLQGPLDEPTLKTIHSIGPAQLYPTLLTSELKPSIEQGKKALQKIESIQRLPLMERYREKLTKRLKAQLEFLETLDTASKTSSTTPLSKVAKGHLKTADVQKFETFLGKLKGTTPWKNSTQHQNTIEQLFDFYNDGIEPDPEEEFHRAIKKLGVQYTCSFEEPDDLVGD